MDHIERVRIRARDLRLGMFVCELDRPWHETPFLFEGFELNSTEDIETVRKYCDYVYIDMRRTEQVEHMVMDDLSGAAWFGKKSASFTQEFQAADSTYRQTSTLVKSFLDEVRFGSGVDVQLSKSAVSECVASVLRNPDAMMYMAQMRDKGEQAIQHSFNVCIFSILLGRLAGLSHKELENVGTCGLLHDVGKIMISEKILGKKEPLLPEEIAILREHPRLGRDILMSARNIYSGAVDAAYCHHENLDGSGYPRGLTGEQIALNARIIGIVEKYDDMTNVRPYRDARSHLDAAVILNKMVKLGRLDDKLSSGFIAYLGTYPPGTIVEMSNGEVAIVLETNPAQRLRPRILVVRDTDRQPVERVVDLAVTGHDARGLPYKVKLVHPPHYLGIELRNYQQAIIEAFG